MKTSCIFLLFAMALLLQVNRVAAQLYQYSGATNGVYSFLAANATATNITHTGFGTNTPCTNGAGISGITVSTVYTTYVPSNPRVYFKITPNAGYELNITGFTAALRRSGTGPSKVRYAYSLDNGATWTDDGFDHAPNNGSCGAMSTQQWNGVLNVSNVTSANGIILALFPYGASNSTGTFQMNSWIINGSVVPAPSQCSPSTSPDLSYNDSLTVCMPGTVDLASALVTDANNTTGTFAYYTDVLATIPVVNPAAVNVSGVYYAVKTTTVGNCSDTVAIPVLIYQSPDGSVMSAGPFCSNDMPVTLTANTPGGTWSGPGITDPVTGIFDPAVLPSGTHTVTYLTQPDVNGCTGQGSINITINAAPDASLLTSDTSVCVNTSSFPVHALYTGGMYSGTGIVDVNNGTFDPVASGIGVFPVIYSLSQNNCTATDTVSISVNAGPAVNITDPGNQCINGSPMNIAVDVPGGVWLGPGITDPNLGTFDPALAGLGYNQLIYIATQNGCQGSDTVLILVNAAPVPHISNPGVLCSGVSQIQLAAMPQNGTWTGSFITTSGVFSPLQSGPGNFQVYYSVTQNGCTGIDTLQLQVNATAQITVTEPDDSVCINEIPFVPSASPSGGTWTGGGVSTGSILNPSLLNPGPHSITYNVVANNCPASQVWNFEVIAAPNATFSLTQNGSTINVQAVIIPGQTYTWNFGDNTSGTGETALHTYSQPGIYTVTLIVNNYCGSDTAVRNVNVNTTGISGYQNDGFKVGPIPTDDIIHIVPDHSDDYTMTIKDISGRQLFPVSLHTGQSTISLATLPSGTYFLECTRAGITSIRKVIKK